MSGAPLSGEYIFNTATDRLVSGESETEGVFDAEVHRPSSRTALCA